MPQITLKGYLCERCGGHKWLTKDETKDKPPRVCPKCKSPYWDTPRRLNIVKKQQLEDMDLKQRRRLR